MNIHTYRLCPYDRGDIIYMLRDTERKKGEERERENERGGHCRSEKSAANIYIYVHTDGHTDIHRHGCRHTYAKETQTDEIRRGEAVGSPLSLHVSIEGTDRRT